jgi:hypothetical protein
LHLLLVAPILYLQASVCEFALGGPVVPCPVDKL